MAEAQCGNKATLNLLMDEQGRELLELERMREAFQQHFPRLYGTGGGPEYKLDFSVYLKGLPRRSVREAKCCEHSEGDGGLRWK